MEELYKKILKSLKLTVTDDGFIMSGDSLVMINGKSVVLPNTPNIDFDKSHVFNPFAENIVKDTDDMLKLKSWVTFNINYIMFVIVDLLLRVSDNNESANLDIQMLLSSKTKLDIDEKTVDNWQKLMKKTVPKQTSIKLVGLFLKKKVKHQNIDNNRGLMINFPLLDEINKNEVKINGVTLRKKDLNAYSIVIGNVLKDIFKGENILAVSNDNTAPATAALLKGFIKFGIITNNLLDKLENIDKEYVNTARTAIEIAESELENLDRFKVSINNAPGNKIDIKNIPIKNNIPTQPTIPMQNTVPPQQSTPQPQQPQQSTQQAEQDIKSLEEQLIAKYKSYGMNSSNPSMPQPGQQPYNALTAYQQGMSMPGGATAQAIQQQQIMNQQHRQQHAQYPTQHYGQQPMMYGQQPAPQYPLPQQPFYGQGQGMPQPYGNAGYNNVPNGYGNTGFPAPQFSPVSPYRY